MERSARGLSITPIIFSPVIIMALSRLSHRAGLGMRLSLFLDV